MAASSIVDAHFHVFRRSATPNVGLLSADVLQRDFAMSDYREALGNAPVDRAIGVHVGYADRGLAELTFMRAAATDPLLIAYVGWLDIGDPGSADLITDLAHDPFVVGIRCSEALDKSGHLVSGSDAISGARHLGKSGLPLDISVRPQQYEGLAFLAASAPGTTFVLGHMGKPLMGGEDEPEWWAGILSLAGLPNMMCKVTAHVTTRDDGPYARDAVIARIRHAFACFGPERVMFGSNWPTCLISISLSAWLDILAEAVSDISAENQERFYRRNAERIYGL